MVQVRGGSKRLAPFLCGVDMGWYKKIAPKRSKAARNTDAARYKSKPNGRTRNPPVIRHDKMIFYSTYCRSLYISGYRAKVCSRYHIAKYFDVPVSTVHRWGEAGALPPPFYWMEHPRGSYPVFLAAQVRVLAMVIRDLVKDHGYVSIPWYNLPDHIAMLQEGYAVAKAAFVSRMDKPTREADRFGVILD